MLNWVSENSTAGLKAATDIARQLTERRPEDVAAWLMVASGQLQTGEPQRAVETLLDAVSRIPHDIRLRLMLCHAFARVGSHDEALKAIQPVLALSPEDPEVTLTYFDTLVGAKQWDTVESLIDSAAELAADRKTI